MNRSRLPIALLFASVTLSLLACGGGGGSSDGGGGNTQLGAANGFSFGSDELATCKNSLTITYPKENFPAGTTVIAQGAGHTYTIDVSTAAGTILYGTFPSGAPAGIYDIQVQLPTYKALDAGLMQLEAACS